MLLDTDALIDWQQELSSGKPLGPRRLVEEHPDAVLRISLITWMEFAEGYPDEDNARCDAFLSHFGVLLPDEVTAWKASRISRHLRRKGRAIGDHDLWIAATALQHNLRLVTRNVRHFQQVPGLQMMSY